MQPMASKNNLVNDLRNMYGIESRPDIDVAFYFDTLHMGLKAVSSMKDAGTWPEIEYEKCNDNVDVIPRNLNLLRSLQSVSKDLGQKIREIKYRKIAKTPRVRVVFAILRY